MADVASSTCPEVLVSFLEQQLACIMVVYTDRRAAVGETWTPKKSKEKAQDQKTSETIDQGCRQREDGEDCKRCDVWDIPPKLRD
jgi:hypothetical protein